MQCALHYKTKMNFILRILMDFVLTMGPVSLIHGHTIKDLIIIIIIFIIGVTLNYCLIYSSGIFWPKWDKLWQNKLQISLKSYIILFVLHRVLNEDSILIMGTCLQNFLLTPLKNGPFLKKLSPPPLGKVVFGRNFSGPPK